MNRKRYLALALLGGSLLLLGQAAGQPPPRGGPPGRPGGPRGPGLNPPPRGSEPLLEELSLTRRERDRAHDALAAYDDTVRKATEQARKDLLVKMKDVLPEGEFKKFKDELESVPLIAALPPGPRGVPEDDLVQRLMSFDKNKDGVITIDELPERMQTLFQQGDKNKDGVLDIEEIKQLAKERSQVRPGRGGPGRGGQGPPPFGGPPWPRRAGRVKPVAGDLVKCVEWHANRSGVPPAESERAPWPKS